MVEDVDHLIDWELIHGIVRSTTVVLDTMAVDHGVYGATTEAVVTSGMRRGMIL